MDKKRRVAMAMVFLMVFSIIDFSGFIHVNASTLNEGTVLTEEITPTLSESDIQEDNVSMSQIQEQIEDSVSSQNSEELLAEGSQSPEEHTTSGELSGITVTGLHYIYANGNAITLKAGLSDDSKTRVYLDNDLDTPLEITGADGDKSNGYDLQKYRIFGGSETDSVASTSITMLGGKVKNVYGGGIYGSISGNTMVIISGGTVNGDVYGGGVYATVEGNTNVAISGTAYIGCKIFGGGESSSAHVNGTANVTISGGTVISYIYKAGTVLSLGKILITGMGDYKGTMTKEFTITPKSIKSATIEPIEDVKATGTDLKSQMDARIIVKDGVNTVSRNDYDITYLINKEKQTTLLLTPSKNTIVTVSVNGKNNYKDAIKKTQTFTILPQSSNAKSVSDNITLVLKAPDKIYTYSGKTIKPQIKVTDTVTNKPIAGKYYKVSYENNVNAGTGTITVSGKNKYYGSESIKFIMQ